MSGVFESIERHPVEYLPTGDKALLMAWVVVNDVVAAVLCLEDGRAVVEGTGAFKFDYRYDNRREVWVDVSKIVADLAGEGDADTDQEAEDHGGEAVPGAVHDPD